MVDFLAGQIDYIYFAHGLAFVLVAATARALAWRDGRTLAWNWLAVWGISAGLSEWLEVFDGILGAHPVLPPLRIVLMLAPCLSMLAFCRASDRRVRIHYAWVVAIPLAVVAAADMVVGVAVTETACRYVLLFPGAAWAAWLFLRTARGGSVERRTLVLPAAAFAGMALASGLIGGAEALGPVPVFGAATFRAMTGIPVQYLRAGAAALLALGLWRYYCRLQRTDERMSVSKGWSRYERGLSAALVLVLVAGWLFAQATAANERAESRGTQEARANTVAAMLPPVAIERLAGTPSDADTEAYAQVRGLLAAVCASHHDILSVAIVVRHGGTFSYAAEAIDESRRRASERPARPGDAYRGSSDDVASLLLEAGAQGGAYRHRDAGSSLSNLVPVHLPNGQVAAVLDLEIDPAEQRQAVAGARLAPILVTLLTSILLVAFFVSDRNTAHSTALTAASERRYRGLVEGSPNGIMLLDPDGRCLTINANGLTAFSLREEDVVGRRLPDLWPAGDRERVADVTGRVAKGERETLETRYVEPGGHAIDLELVLNPVTDGDGQVTHLVGIVSDITERQRAQSAVERSHRFTQVILAISARFLNMRAERVDAATREALREVGAFLGVDRAQLFHLSADRMSFSLTHEWAVPGATSRLPALQLVSVDDYPWMWSTLESAGIVLVPDVAMLPDEAAIERARLSSQQVGAFLCVPVHRRGTVTGFLALDVFGRRRAWSEDEVTLLRIVADVLSNGLARKLADEALRESEQRFQRAFRNNPAAMAIVWSETQRIVEVNDAFLGLLERPVDEVVGKTVDEIHLIDSDEERAAFSNALATAEPLRHCELGIRTGKNERRHVSVSMDAFELAGQRFMLAVALDLSARVRAEEALREREEVFRSISAAAQDAIIMIDSDARVTVWNDAAERMFGYTREEAEGQSLDQLILPEEYEPAFLEGFGHFRTAGEGPFVGQAQQVFAHRKDGAQLPVELSASAVKVRGRWHAVGILRDITERLKVEEALWKAKEESESANYELQRSVERANRLAEEAAVANAYKSEFLANMSHEIRTPMNGIIGMTGLLLDTPLAPEQHEYADTVRTCADSLLTIINDILDFSKIEAGKLDLEALDFDLAGALDDMMDVLAMRAHEKGLEVACLVSPDVPTLLRGDPGRLRQVITNLIGNSIKFTEHGEVTLAVTVEDAGRTDALLRFVVRDTGIGIPDAKVGTLFQPFTQVDSSHSRRFGGTGLGLSICRRLSEMMGGAIGVESQEGVGSSFWFTARFERQPVAQATVAHGELEGVRVLGQDDNGTNRLVLAGMLEAWGCRHAEVESGRDAIRRLREAADAGDPYRIAILDMKTPDLPGDELGRIIRSDPALTETRLVMMTSVGRRGDASLFQASGFVGYLTKPVKASHLRNLLTTLVGRPGSASPAEPMVTRHMVAEAQRRRTRLLLAEDNITNQKVAIKVLEKMGHRVDAVANGAEAIKALRTMPYDLVFMDVQMPEMDGLEATRRIRDERTGVRNPRIPIVAMTAHAMKGDRERCLEAGMDDYVSKPINPQEVGNAVARWVPAEAAPTPVAAQPASGVFVKLDDLPAAREPKAALAGCAGLPDREALLTRLGGDEEVFVEVIKIFLEDVPNLLGGMDQALAAGDAKTLRRLAHSLKGSSGTAGAEALQHASLVLEQAAAAGDLEAAAPLIPPVKDLFGEVLATMGGWVGREVRG